MLAFLFFSKAKRSPRLETSLRRVRGVLSRAMHAAKTRPLIMANARDDLVGNVSGQFSPEDWEEILDEAERRLATSGKAEPEAWIDVIREFHRERYFGFVPNYSKPKEKAHEKNLGLKFLYFVTRSFLVTKVIVLYSGARWSADYEPFWGWIFFGAMTFMVCSYSLFLWRHARGRKDD